MGNLPPGVTIPQLTEFLNAAMKQLGIAVTAQVRKLIFLESFLSPSLL